MVPLEIAALEEIPWEEEKKGSIGSPLTMKAAQKARMDAVANAIEKEEAFVPSMGLREEEEREFNEDSSVRKLPPIFFLALTSDPKILIKPQGLN